MLIHCKNYNKKYTHGPHNMRSLATMPRIPQLLSQRIEGRKAGKKNRIEVYLVENEDSFYILAEGQRNTHWLQHVVHNPIISFSVCSRSFGGIARIVHSQKGPKEIANQITEVINGKYKRNKSPIVALTTESDTVRYKR
jgi:F420H(2)-dependent quinone reductase